MDNLERLTIRSAADSAVARFIGSRVVGQHRAIYALADEYTKFCAGLQDTTRPVATLLFLGPTGVGKTRVVETFCEFLFGEGQKPLKISCGEFQSDHEISKLIGAPAGYIGHGQTKPVLTTEVVNRTTKDGKRLNVVLFDEVEKAGGALFQLLLGVLDRGELTTSAGEKINFCNTFIVMTSNLGARAIEAAPTAEEKEAAAVEAARHFFSPEQFNRLDEVVMFENLTIEQIEGILQLEIKYVSERAALTLRLSDEARVHLLAQGYDERYGARHLKRAVDRLVTRPLSSLLAQDLLRRGSTVHITLEDDALAFLRAAEPEVVAASKEVAAPPALPQPAKFADTTPTEQPKGRTARMLQLRFRFDDSSQGGWLWQKWFKDHLTEKASSGRITEALVSAGFRCNQDPYRAIKYVLNEWKKKNWLVYDGYHYMVNPE